MKATHKAAVAVGSILANADNPRVLDKKSPGFRELVDSVRAVGVQVPVCLTPAKGKGRYQLRAGTRRVEAAKVARRKTVPALVYADLTNAEAFELTFLENFAREDLTPIEQSRAVEILLKRNGKDLEAVAARLGRSVQWVQLRVRLQALTPKWLAAVKHPGRTVFGWGPGHLALVARFGGKTQDELLRDLGYGGETRTMTVKGLQDYLEAKVLHRLSAAPWKVEDPAIVKKAGACSKCKKRSSLQGRLFHPAGEDVQKNDRCLDRACWKVKLAAYVRIRAKVLKKEYKGLVFIRTEGPRWGDSDADEKAFGTVLNPWQVHEVKEGEPGAEPALVVSGPHTGELLWVTGRQREARSTPPTGPKTLAQRRAILASRRSFLVVDYLRADLEKQEVKHLAVPGAKSLTKARADLVVRLASVFGTSHKRDLAYSSVEDWQVFDIKVGEPLVLLWQTVRLVLLKRLEHSGPTGDFPRYRALEVKRIARLIGADLKPLRARAAKEKPEPKSWAKLNEDGTPKKAPAKSGRTPAKKASQRRPSKATKGK